MGDLLDRILLRVDACVNKLDTHQRELVLRRYLARDSKALEATGEPLAELHDEAITTLANLLRSEGIICSKTELLTALQGCRPASSDPALVQRIMNDLPGGDQGGAESVP